MGPAVACGVVGVGGWSSFCEPQSGVAHGELGTYKDAHRQASLNSVAGDRPVIPGLTLHTANRVASRRAHRPATRRATRRTACSHPACGRGAGYVQESWCAHARATGTIDHDGDASGCLTSVVWSASRAARRVGRLPLVTFLPLVGRGRDPESCKGKQRGPESPLEQTMSTCGLTSEHAETGTGGQDEHGQEALRPTRTGSEGGRAWAQWRNKWHQGHMVTARAAVSWFG